MGYSRNDSQYNGWANYETWLVNVHFGDLWYEMQTNNELHGWGGREFSEHVEELFEYSQKNLFLCDVVRAFLSSVNWDEIAEHYQNEEEEKRK